MLSDAIERRELAVTAGCALVAGGAWLYLLVGPMPMDMGMRWGAAEGGLLVAMWSVMMLAMMLPSATGILKLVAQNRNGSNGGGVAIAFSFGYFAVWSLASAGAAGLQWLLHNEGLMRQEMQTSNTVGGIVLIIAGLYQFHPLKQSCLVRCRDPLSFLMTSWRDGVAGAAQMGMKYGLVCAGCCWALMTVLFAVGIMNLLAVAALAALIVLEKMSSFGRRLSRVTGAALVLGGLITLLP
jgi:predicted metal-binding membrane protein